MPFYSGDKEYSDQQVAADAKRCKKERHDWCEQQAREYLAAHQRPKYYYTEYYIPEAEQQTYIRWAQDDVETIQKAIADDIAEYGPYENEIEEDDMRIEVIRNLDIDMSYYLPEESDKYRRIDLLDVKFDKYICCEKATVLRFEKEDDAPRKTECAVKLTDEEYIRVLTELLYSPEPLSFDGLCSVLPEIGKKIWKDCGSLYVTSAIFLTDLNKQVDEILAQHGGRENTPHVGIFDNPFAIMAEYLATKESAKEEENK
jgi:hypothetical protein